MRFLWALLAIWAAGAAIAEAPGTSLRPVLRPAALAAIAARAPAPERSLAKAGPLRPRARPDSPPPLAEGDTDDETAAVLALAAMSGTMPRPHPRPGSVTPVDPPVRMALTSDDLAANTGGVVVLASAGTVHSPRPEARPGALVQKAMAKRRQLRKGAICGDVALQGTEVGRVSGSGGCGIAEAVRLRSVSGIALSQEALIDCTTAKTLKRWVEGGIQPAFGSKGGGLARLQVAAHYACRPRNNQRGAKLSEHGKGHAVDISAFVLRDGTVVTVLKDWRTKAWGATLKRIHAAACGPFGTVLGPDGDRFHQDHIHVDTARYRSGSYCR